MAAAERVLSLVRRGNALDVIAAQEGMPTLDTLQRWLDENTAFRAQYDRARQLQGEVLADQVITVIDLTTSADNAGGKLRAEARKWRYDAIRKDRPAPGTAAREPSEETVARLQRALERVRNAPPVPGRETFTFKPRSEAGSEQDR